MNKILIFILFLLLALAMALAKALAGDAIGPDTAILHSEDGCFPCIKAVAIIKKLQEEGYNVIILKNVKDIGTYPTLIIRKDNKILFKKRGLLSEKKYRVLIPKIKPEPGIPLTYPLPDAGPGIPLTYPFPDPYPYPAPIVGPGVEPVPVVEPEPVIETAIEHFPETVVESVVKPEPCISPLTEVFLRIMVAAAFILFVFFAYKST